ncbi:multidrug efflux RND transporter permease subunit [Planctomycetales bacterium]|nr:multidrug efflux RND transporter permease subunit [Planctomycetales bacterium]GHS98473.1 multidrug efflux RND transporter permease subunit [Planctomycetales bacterium]GHT05876.1 multidrug efflux RND transporter permease subunit [Planctomycetales bacterium]
MMISQTFIDKPKLAMVISIVTVLLGVLCVTQIPVAEYPEVAPPQIVVSAAYPGASAEVIADTIGAPIEAEINGVDDMLYFSSESNNNGSYSLSISFEPNSNDDIAQVNVQNAVRRAEAKLPAETRALGVNVIKRSTDILGLFVFTIDETQTKMSMLELGNYVRMNVKDELARIPGISQTEIMGASEYAMRIWLDPMKMAELGISPGDLASAIKSQNLQAASGTIGSENSNDYLQLKVNTLGRLNTPEQFGDIVVRTTADGRVVHLRDIARVELGADSYAWNATYNGKPMVAMAIYRNTGANALAASDAAKAKIAELSPSFPKGVSVRVGYDPTKFIRASMKEIIETLILTLILVVAITYFFLQSWRATIVPTLAIPVSLMGTFFVLYPLGYSVNLLTMFALILVVGSLVDDAIVVVENITRLMHDEKLSARQATIKSMGQITGAILATTLVNIAIYAPIGFYGGMVGTIYKQFSVTICVALVFSTINALTLSPALCSLILRPNDNPSRIFNPFNKGLNFSRNFYLTCTKFLVRKSLVTLAIFAAVLGLGHVTHGSLFTSFLPPEDKGGVLTAIELAPGATLARTRDAGAQFSDLVMKIPGVQDVVVVNGFSFMGGQGENLGLAIVEMKPWEERKTPDLLINSIMRQAAMAAAQVPSAKINVFQPPAIMGLGVSGGVTFMMQAKAGQSARELEIALNQMLGKLNAAPETLMAFSPYNANTPQLFLEIDREKARIMNVPTDVIFSTLQANLSDYYINDFNFNGFSFKVKMQAEGGDRSNIADIEKINLQSTTGKLVPLSAVASVRYAVGPRVVTRFEQARSASVTSMAKPGISSSQLMTRIEEIMRADFPEYSVAWTDMSFQERGNAGKIGYLMMLSLIFAYLFLVAQYESWTMPLSVVSSVAVALLGAVLGLKLCGMTVSIYAELGFIMLIGLAGKNAILMAEFAKQAREDEGLPIEVAAQNGGRVRYRAVLMTAWSFLIGVFPMVIATGAGAGSRQAIGITTFSGMLLATVAGIVLVPPLYAMFQKMREYFNPLKPKPTDGGAEL